MAISISQIQQFLSGKKTYFVAATAFIGLLSAWSQKTITNQTFIQDAVMLILTATMRGGVAKSGPIVTPTPDKPDVLEEEVQDIIDMGNQSLLPPDLLGRKGKRRG